MYLVLNQPLLISPFPPLCVSLYKEGLSSQLHVLHLWLRQVLSCKFFAFGNVIKATIPGFTLFPRCLLSEEGQVDVGSEPLCDFFGDF